MADITVINVPLDVPTELLNNGLVDLYATDKGWDKNGELTAVEYLAAHIRTMVKNDFLTTYERYVQAQAAKKAQADVNSFFA